MDVVTILVYHQSFNLISFFEVVNFLRTLNISRAHKNRFFCTDWLANTKQISLVSFILLVYQACSIVTHQRLIYIGYKEFMSTLHGKSFKKFMSTLHVFYH